jgi:hypothetical protein
MHQARKLQECWALRGWIVKSAGQDNSFCITAKARDLLANRQTPQTRADSARTATNPIIDKEK